MNYKFHLNLIFTLFDVVPKYNNIQRIHSCVRFSSKSNLITVANVKFTPFLNQQHELIKCQRIWDTRHKTSQPMDNSFKSLENTWLCLQRQINQYASSLCGAGIEAMSSRHSNIIFHSIEACRKESRCQTGLKLTRSGVLCNMTLIFS